MAEKSINALQVFDNGAELSYVEKNGEILFTADEIGKHLGYGNPAEAINRLFQRNQNELKLYATSVKLTAVDEKQRETRVFTEEGVYILSMLARTNEAKKFRARVALLLRRVRQESLKRQVEAARQEGMEAGRKKALALRQRLTPQRRAQMNKALRYKGMGLELREIGKLMDCSHQMVFYLLKDAALIGKGA